jgi:hypothetical protein
VDEGGDDAVSQARFLPTSICCGSAIIGRGRLPLPPQCVHGCGLQSVSYLNESATRVRNAVTFPLSTFISILVTSATAPYYGYYAYAPGYSYGYAPAYTYGYAPAYSYGYAPAYYPPAYNYGYAPAYYRYW